MPSAWRKECSKSVAFFLGNTSIHVITGSNTEMTGDIFEEYMFVKFNTITNLYVNARSPKDRTRIIFAFFFLERICFNLVLALDNEWDFTTSHKAISCPLGL